MKNKAKALLPESTPAIVHAPSSVRRRVLAVLATWPARAGYDRPERDRMVHDCVARIIEAWGGRWLNPDADLQALDVQCARGHIWRFGSAKLKNGLWCPQCSHERRRTGLEAMQALARRHGGRCLSDTIWVCIATCGGSAVTDTPGKRRRYAFRWVSGVRPARKWRTATSGCLGCMLLRESRVENVSRKPTSTAARNFSGNAGTGTSGKRPPPLSVRQVPGARSAHASAIS
ncbi:hypothetical protein BN2476_500150 [Paraburkholderia piptadeniae]|uniref:Uncharacterized protein n=1 Tax=Paraburkholderia piptadeniae TaxID=1701573 RepID=A0A1N7SG37_9BURK|nr:hypothetical protein BN2476_500150 [Paraburkholderia piptadeniae]